MAQTKCKHPDGCDRPGRLKRGWCSMHYQRVMATGDPGPSGKISTWGDRKGTRCSHPECERGHVAGGYCGMHYKRIQEGRPLGGVDSLRREMPPGSESWNPGQRHRYYKYGLTPEAFDYLLARQGGRCYICGTAEPNGKGWSVDHCHDTNAVRFIACNPCNVAFGFIREDPVIAQRLLEVCLEWQAAKATQAS